MSEYATWTYPSLAATDGPGLAQPNFPTSTESTIPGLDHVRPESAERAASGKPANIIEKMVGGRMEKFFAEVTLINQPWVRDDSKTIKALGADLASEDKVTLAVVKRRP